jgi:hypothetical protein
MAAQRGYAGAAELRNKTKAILSEEQAQDISKKILELARLGSQVKSMLAK